MYKTSFMKHFILFLIILTLAGCYGATPEKTGLEGKPLPEFNLLLPDSSNWINIRNAPAGKAVALFYFSPACPYCRAQTEEIIEDMDKLKNIHFYFVAGFPLQGLKDFCNEYQLVKYSNITSGIDTGDVIKNYFEITAVPYMAIYGKGKTLHQTFVGKIYSSQLKKVAEQ
jgi:thiol-disulfide isomerase/thioredoxin